MKVENDSELIYKICIIGSGPAGIITAIEYAGLNPDKKVLLVEYGIKGRLFTKNGLDDTIVVKNPLNHHIPYECTNKGFGGTSATWGGRCVMYDEIDFIERPILAGGCTWDVKLYNELKTYLPKSAQYFECGNSLFDLKEIPYLKTGPIAENFKEGIVSDTVVERYSMPTRFGKRYAKYIADIPNLTLFEGYEAREFSIPDDQGNVSTLSIKNVTTSKTINVKAENFVLAAGTQEITRILLRNKQLFKLLKEPPKALGKYYQGHLSGKIASVHFTGVPKKTNYGFLRDNNGVYIRRRFQFSKTFLVENDLLNTAIWLDNPLYLDPKHKSGAMSLMYLMMLVPVLGKKLAPPAIANSITKGMVTSVRKHIWNIIKDLPDSLLTPGGIFIKRYLLKRKLPGVFLFNPENRYALHFHSEQTPFIENRMELGPDGETLNIYYTLTEPDINSVIKLHEVLDNWLQETGAGKLEYWFEKEKLPEAIRQMSKDGIHQSGTTRIADSSDKGVVDRNLRLWGTNNVFICSSSVFPTSSQANPTFLLGAFAVRLAKYITQKL